LKATFEEETRRRTEVFEWFSTIKSCVNSAEDVICSGLGPWKQKNHCHRCS